MSLRNMMAYSFVGSAFWYMFQAMGVGFGVSIFASLIGPPLLHIAFLLHKAR